MAPPVVETTQKYDSAAPGWGGKMRLLGYNDAYLGFLASGVERAPGGHKVIDVGCGTGAMAEGWVALHGPAQRVTLLDPSPQMLTRAGAALSRRAVSFNTACTTLEDYAPTQRFETVLAAHVLEHSDDPLASLAQMRELAAPGARLWLVVSKPHWCNAIIWFQWRHKSYRASEVGEMLADTGWQLERSYAFPSGPPSRTSRGYVATAI